MQKPRLTEKQKKIKNLITPIVKEVLIESGKRDTDFLEFLDRLHQEFKSEVTIINAAIERGKHGKDNAIIDVLKQYMKDTNKPNFGEAIKAIIDFRL